MPHGFLEQTTEAWEPREEGIEGLRPSEPVCQELVTSRGPVGPEGQACLCWVEVLGQVPQAVAKVRSSRDPRWVVGL